jgi:putative membrane protein
MIFIANFLVAVVAALHVFFLVLEMFLWDKPLGLKIFRNEKARDSKVLAANQGLYNGFLAAGLVWGLLHPTPGFAFQIKVFFLLCVIVQAPMARRPSAAGSSTCRRRPRRSPWSCSGWLDGLTFPSLPCVAKSVPPHSLATMTAGHPNR